MGHQTTGPEISGQLPDLHVPPPSLCLELCFPIPENQVTLVGSEPQLCCQARPPETAFPSWIFGVSGFIKVQGAGNWDCGVFAAAACGHLLVWRRKRVLCPSCCSFLKVTRGCGGVKLLGLTHSSFGLINNFCQVF